MDRQAKFMWMKDLLDHLAACHEQWQSADPCAEQYLVDSMKRDLEEFRRLCDSVRRDAGGSENRLRPHASAAV